MGQAKTSARCSCCGAVGPARGQPALDGGWLCRRERGRPSTWVCPTCAPAFVAARKSEHEALLREDLPSVVGFVRRALGALIGSPHR